MIKWYRKSDRAEACPHPHTHRGCASGREERQKELIFED